MRITEQSHCDVFEELVGNNTIRYDQDIPPNLDDFTRSVLDIVKRMGMTVKMGDVEILDNMTSAPTSKSFKVQNPTIFNYVDVFPVSGQYMYVKDEEHKEAVCPDEVIARMLGGEYVEKNGKRIIKIGNVMLVDSRSQDDRKKMAEYTRRTWQLENN